MSLLALLLVLVVAGWAMKTALYLLAVLRLAVAYKAKILCSGVFVSGRSVEDVAVSDLAFDNHHYFRWIPASIDRSTQRVCAGWRRLFQGVAIHRPGLGSTLIRPALAAGQEPAHAARAQGFLPIRPNVWPGAPPRPNGILEALLDRAFVDHPGRPPQRTRAIAIVQGGHLVAERYAPGFGPDMPVAGWSLAKMAVNALIGVLVREGRLELTDPAPVDAWSHPGDPRQAITIEHLLRMTSGLRFRETYRDLREDVMQMLLGEPDCAGFAARKPLDHPPGTHWQYSGGSTNILSGVIRTLVGPDDYAGFPRGALFEPLGMSTAVLEMDASGHFVGSSFMYASARDWARLGQLYLQDGVVAGRRIFPPGWVEFSGSPTPESPDGEFGAHLWRRLSKFYQGGTGPVDLPDGTYHGIGFEGQFVSVVPAEGLVVVRLGLTRRPRAWVHDRFLADVIDALRSGA
jgi:hypothetical protein